MAPAVAKLLQYGMQWGRVEAAGGVGGGGPRPRPRSRRLGRAGGQPYKLKPKLPQQLLLNSSKASTLGWQLQG